MDRITPKRWRKEGRKKITSDAFRNLIIIISKFKYVDPRLKKKSAVS